MSTSKSLPSVHNFANVVGHVLGHLETDVIWIPHKLNPRDAKGHRVRKNAPHIKDLTENEDYFRIKTWSPQDKDRYMVNDVSGTYEVENWTIRVPCDTPALRRDNLAFLGEKDRDTKFRIQDVIVYDYETHTKRSKAYEVKRIQDDCRYSNIIRLDAVEIGIVDTLFIGVAV